MTHLDATRTQFHLPFHRLVDALRDMFVEGCVVPARQVLQVQGPRQGTVLIMPAWREDKRLGVKTVNIFPANSQDGLPGLHASYNLFSARTGEMLCSMDGMEITSRRTAAASALAASYLARAGASKYLIVGTGRVAQLMVEAMLVVRPISQVRVWNRNFASAVKLAGELENRGLDAVAVEDLQSSVEWADIVTCATLATSPLVLGKWLRPGAHLDLIGSFRPDMVEADAECFRVSRVYLDTEEALVKSGDVLQAIEAGAFAPATGLCGTLQRLCRGQCAYRKTNDEITLFKSVGTALEDLAAAELVYDSSLGGKPASKL